ncbi:hypothetical protein ACI65C_010026, partial [Semiaphis heraclei]
FNSCSKNKQYSRIKSLRKKKCISRWNAMRETAGGGRSIHTVDKPMTCANRLGKRVNEQRRVTTTQP